jgi:hypothetical protein
MALQIGTDAGRQTMKTILCVAIGACAFAATGFGATQARSAECINQYDPNQTPAQADACAALASASAQPKPPAIPTKNSKLLAKAAFTRDYNTVWKYISPVYQGAVSRSKWLSCQKNNPVAPPGVKVNSVAVAQSGNIPMKLTKYGTQEVFQVQLQVIFTRAGSKSADVVFTYWLHDKNGKWVAVWLPDVYSKYKSGGCTPVPARGIY